MHKLYFYTDVCINLTSFVESGWTGNLRILHSPLATGEWTGTQARFQYVLSERFMQDVLEDYFGHRRTKGGRSDIPQQFGYNNLTIAAHRDIAPI